MGFNRKQRNRRFVRRNVLDVRVRTREVRSARLRLLVASCGLAVACAVLLYGLWVAGQWALDEFVLRNPAFALKRLEIDTGQRLPPELIWGWSGVQQGDNLIELDLERVKQRLSLMSVVESVSLQRLPPDALLIRVVPRELLAEIRAMRKGRSGDWGVYRSYVDRMGVVVEFPEASASILTQNLVRGTLPLLVGVEGPVAGRVLTQGTVGAALELVTVFEESAMLGVVELKSIDVSESDTLRVTTSHGAEITLGLTDIPLQLKKWRLAHDEFLSRGQLILTMDLSVTNGVPVTLEPRRTQQSAGGPATKIPTRT